MEFEIRLHRVRGEPFSDEAIREHVDRLADLDDAGRLIAAGPRRDGTGGVILAHFDSADDATRFATTDPYVVGGWETAEVHPWLHAHRANGYLDQARADRVPRARRRFVPVPLDKRRWPRSPLPGQIVFVTSVDAAGTVDVAPKSWLSMAAFDPPTISFGCNTSHLTFVNTSATEEFVINVVPSPLAARAWTMLDEHGTERVDHAQLDFGPATLVRPPVILDCVAHYECRLDRTVVFASGEVVVFGRIVAAAVDERCLTDDVTAAYRSLDPCFMLEERLYAGLAAPMRVPDGDRKL